MENNELAHVGVKGMRWGQRRYQNKDGSLTPEGKLRYQKKKDKALKKAQKKDLKAQKKARKEEVSEERSKEAVLKSRSAKKLYENADLFSDSELQTAYNRLNLENKIASLYKEQEKVSKGKRFVEKTVEVEEDVADLIDRGSKVYNNVAKIYNAYQKKHKTDKSLMIIE